MTEKKAKGTIVIDYDSNMLNINAVESWIEDQLQKIQDTGGGITGFSIELED
ncbi:hypothetical protein LCGC14_0195110 [marine sediment metagenome]|uniref:Uncharacterized protein n=1 Tax=marine sediment metagenome TaxID=412755 RepID=A0A0F9XNA3_9ZZZZ